MIKYKHMVSFSSALERLRQKPEAVRARYLFFSVGISFASIVALWAFSLQASFGTLFKSDVVDAVRESAQNVGKSAPVSLENLMKAGKTLQEGGEMLRESMPSSISQPADVPPKEERLPSSERTATTPPVSDDSGSAPSEGVRRDMSKPNAMPETPPSEGSRPPSSDASVPNSSGE